MSQLHPRSTTVVRSRVTSCFVVVVVVVAVVVVVLDTIMALPARLSFLAGWPRIRPGEL